MMVAVAIRDLSHERRAADLATREALVPCNLRGVCEERQSVDNFKKGYPSQSCGLGLKKRAFVTI